MSLFCFLSLLCIKSGKFCRKKCAKGSAAAAADTEEGKQITADENEVEQVGENVVHRWRYNSIWKNVRLNYTKLRHENKIIYRVLCQG